MKKIISSLLIFVFAVALSGCCNCMSGKKCANCAEGTKEESSAEFGEITHEQLKKAIKDGQVFLIDVNKEERYVKEHIANATSFYDEDFEKKLPPDKTSLVVAYCGGPKCMAWEKAALKMQSLGYTNVMHYKSGINGWLEAEGKS